MILSFFKKGWSKARRLFGQSFEPSSIPLHERSPDGGMLLVKFVDEDGKFDYSQYREVQVAGNKSKLDRVWAMEDNVRAAAERVRSLVPPPLKFGLCHGTRRGLEQRWFSEFLGCVVLGTEISDTAAQFENTIQWDFHEVKPEWLGAVDFIYSNSWDHSFDPQRCITGWMTCLRPGGVCVLEHASDHEPVNVRAMDPFKVQLAKFVGLLNEWGSGDFRVREVVPTPVRHSEADAQHLIVIQRQ